VFAQIVYNQATRKFVLFFHLDTAGFTPVPGQAASGHVGVLTADKACLRPHAWGMVTACPVRPLACSMLTRLPARNPLASIASTRHCFNIVTFCMLQLSEGKL
jgi:hypothetical protein